jgi:uncharacterized membrane protein
MTAITKPRIISIDVLRGLVMVIMALDHTRDFFHHDAMLHNPLDLSTTSAPLFFTRWITHFCAPVFVFLSGISAGLAAMRKSKAEASSFLIKRGLWLIFVEIAIVTLGLTFNPIYSFLVLQVIWALGWGMILLGICMRISRRFVLAVGLMIVAFHNILDTVLLQKGTWWATLTEIFITSRGLVVPVGAEHYLGFFYAILPWAGLMFIGFGISHWFTQMEAPKRKRTLLLAGFGAIALFVVLRVINTYGDPDPYISQSSVLYKLLSFINTSKYPPSLQYMCMTIGPALLLLAFFERFKNGVTRVLTVYGKVPFFYYIIHFYILHFLLVIVFFATGYSVNDIIPHQSPFLFRPNEFGFPLSVVYLIWLSVVAVLYKPCKWFAGYKERHKEKWWVHYI